MNHHRTDVPRRHAVLQFKAEPEALAGLRRTVADRLAAWGVPAVRDEVQLIVNELATNVITHIGEGTPGTLVLELREDRILVGVHDTSPALPCPQNPPDDAEAGRGLVIIEELCTSWGVTSYSTGKKIWCELLVPDPLRAGRRGALALDHYASQTGISGDLLAASIPVREEVATDLIAALLTHLTLYGLDPDDLLDRAQMHFEAELEEVRQ